MVFGNSVAVLCVFAVCCFGLLKLSESRVPKEEVDALQKIAKELGTTFWRFNAELCKVDMVGISQTNPSGSDGYVDCACSFASNIVCHVIRMLCLGA
ncbi:probable LRR receptor-like serine/threonine-protein kinase RFK1 [Henckelia pumila]|uniref:probable LRR receptor-like serine/threonine-protein kinase RFK1 n=1 Tax=Henckelia pumila TaxID=405737 RepID=UPI003C6DDBE0